MKRSQIESQFLETAGALSLSVLKAWRRGGAVERAHVCFATLRPQLNDP